MKIRGGELVFTSDVADWVWDKLGLDPDKSATAIGIKRNNKIIVGCTFTRYYPKISVELSIASDGSMWATHDFLRAVFSYVFIQLRCKRLTLTTKSKNRAARRFCEHLGFVQEGLLRYGYEDDDAVIYGMYSNNNRWVRV